MSEHYDDMFESIDFQLLLESVFDLTDTSTATNDSNETVRLALHCINLLNR